MFSLSQAARSLRLAFGNRPYMASRADRFVLFPSASSSSYSFGGTYTVMRSCELRYVRMVESTVSSVGLGSVLGAGPLEKGLAVVASE